MVEAPFIVRLPRNRSWRGAMNSGGAVASGLCASAVLEVLDVRHRGCVVKATASTNLSFVNPAKENATVFQVVLSLSPTLNYPLLLAKPKNLHVQLKPSGLR
jgi:hypothetical protein